MKTKKIKQSKLHVVKGDTVVVISGADKGKTGVVQKVLLDEAKAIVLSEGTEDKSKINLKTKHIKPNAQNPKGGIVKTEAPVNVSKLMVIPKGEKEPSRIGRKKDKDGKLVRFSKKTNKILK
jgi:ribosomal protein L24, bacterial/organelle